MNHDYPQIDCDILIVGGGSAGAMAAIRAKEIDPRQRVVVLEKGDAKYSGCIARGMDALNIVAVPGIATPELYVESNSLACEGIMDEPVNYKMAERSWGLMQKLVSWGVCFPVDEKGDYEILQVHPKGRFCVTMKEPELKTILAKRMVDLGTRVINRSMALELMTEGDRACGAMAMDVRTGEVFGIRAKSVILAAGGTARFGLPNNGYLYGVYDFPGNTGDGYCLAYHAGAELSGFEYTLVYYIVKDINAPLFYITLTRGCHLVNAFDERRDKDHPSIRSMFLEHLEERGPMRIKLSHLPEDKIREIESILFTTERPSCQRFYRPPWRQQISAQAPKTARRVKDRAAIVSLQSTIAAIFFFYPHWSRGTSIRRICEENARCGECKLLWGLRAGTDKCVKPLRPSATISGSDDFYFYPDRAPPPPTLSVIEDVYLTFFNTWLFCKSCQQHEDDLADGNLFLLDIPQGTIYPGSPHADNLIRQI